MKAIASANRILERWGLPKEERGKLLPPKAMDSIDRAAWLLAIHKALRIVYPKNLEMRSTWPTRRNDAFENKSPIEIMNAGGVEGMIEVVHHLEEGRTGIPTRLEVLHLIAAYVLDGEEEATRWMNSPIPALGGRRPIDVAITDAGFTKCRAILGAIEHGLPV